MRTARLVMAILVVAAPALAFGQDSAVTVPEPDTLFLLGAGAVALLVARFRKKK